MVTGVKRLFIYMWTLCPRVYVTVHPAGGKALSAPNMIHCEDQVAARCECLSYRR